MFCKNQRPPEIQFLIRGNSIPHSAKVDQVLVDFLQVCLDVTEALTPDLIIFLSHFVCVHAEGDYPKFFPKKELWDWTKSRGIEYIYVNHPSSAHWNGAMPAKYAKAHGLTSRDFFCEWLKQNWMK